MPTPATATPSRAILVAVSLVVALAYFAAARLGLLLANVHGSVSPVWPAAGIATGALLLGGARLWPGIALGAWAANALTDVPAFVPLVIAAGNTLGAIVGLWCWRRAAQRTAGHEGLRDALAGVAAAITAPLVSATVGVGALIAFSATTSNLAGKLWLTWWSGDALGILLMTPVLLAASEFGRLVRGARPRDAVRLLLVLAAAAVGGWLAFLVQHDGVVLFAAFPVLLLATAWFGAAGVRVLVLFIAAGAIGAAYAGLGPFVGGSNSQNLLNLQIFLAAIALAALVLPAFRSGEDVLVPVVVLLGGWMLSGWMFLLLHGGVVHRQQEFFQERVAEAQASIRVRMTSYTDALRGGARFIAASQSLRRADWRVYAETLELEARYPGINTLGVIFVVPPAGEEQWLAAMRADGTPEMKLSPFPRTADRPGDLKYVITYVEPSEPNKVLLGRNIATEPTRRAAAEAARDLGEPRLHRRAPDSRDLQIRSGLILYHAFYAKGAALTTVEQRRAAHLGWVYAQTFPDIFLENVLGPNGEFVQLHLFESESLSRERLLFTSHPSDASALPRFEQITQLELAGQVFHLAWSRGPKFPRLEQSPAIWAASSFAMATMLLAGLIMSLQSTGRRAHEIVVRQTGELTASEARFRQAFEFAGIGMALVALDGRWMRVNKVLCEIVGYPEAELLEKTFQQITHPDDLTVDLLMMRELIEGRRRTYQKEKRYFHRKGHIVWIRLTVSVVRDVAENPIHFISQIEDVTLSRELEENLARARDHAVEASRLKSEFLATMSHEIRTPMNGMIGMTTLLRDTPLTPTQEEHVRTLETSGEMLLAIINRILDYSKIEAGRMELETAPFNLRACVEEAIGMFGARAQAKQLRIECTIEPSVPAWVSGDVVRLRQILVNLMDNAIKFTDRGQVTLTVMAEPAERMGGGQRLHFVVRDTGIGIAPAGMTRLFKSFSQVDASTTRRFGGTGLGLVISRRLAELMGGTMWAESEPGKGSAFRFTVRIVPIAHQPEEPAASALASTNDRALGQHCPLRLLIAEDNLVNQRVARLLLERLGYEVATATDGKEALSALTSVAYDAVLMDVEMPKLDGCEVTRQIRALQPSTTRPWIIALTAAATENDRERVFAAGMNDFLTKPVRSETLAAALRRAHAALTAAAERIKNGS